ncbi:MAG: sigma-54 dependent transcriptional regulator [Ketobacteraceae bacterium]|nr:sigma-54 dependent transcriptional regulator [Ketobacteraceae bacterium]
MRHILLVDDDDSFTSATRDIIELLGHHVTVAPDLATAKASLTKQRFDTLLLDVMLPDGSGFEVLEAISAGSATRIVVITGHDSIKSIVTSILGPNITYLTKPIDLAQIRTVLGDTTEDSGPSYHFGVLVGESGPMKSLYEMIERVGTTNANVLLQGESGSGKELVAQAIHNTSQCKGPFVAANCGAMARELIGSELFGHEKGAFTGAVNRKPGLFEQARGGTLFLDEITEMPLDMQPNLLRVLETGKVTRLGGTKELEIDCRVISATNRSETRIVEEQCLREDIYYRLAVFPIRIPPLRERKEDIGQLCDVFIQELNRQYGTTFQLAEEDLSRLIQYDWPGNVRELRHLIHRCFIMTPRDSTSLELPTEIASPFSKAGTDRSNPLRPGNTIETVERELIRLTLDSVAGDKPKAAEMLGISLKTLYNRLKQYEES